MTQGESKPPSDQEYARMQQQMEDEVSPGPTGQRYLEQVKKAADTSACATCPPAENPPTPSSSSPPLDLDLSKTEKEGQGNTPAPPAPPTPPKRRSRGEGGGGNGKGNGGSKADGKEEVPKKPIHQQPFFWIFLGLVGIFILGLIAYGFASLVVTQATSPEAVDNLREFHKLQKELSAEKEKPKASVATAIDTSSPCYFSKERRGNIDPQGCKSITIEADLANPKIYWIMNSKHTFRGSYAIHTLKKDEVRENAVRPILYCQTRNKDEAAYSSSNCDNELARLTYPVTVWIAFTDTPLTISK